jgi:hypothetical protein
MPGTRWDYVQRLKAESGQTGTATYDLPNKDFCPRIMLTAYSTPTASTTPATPLSDAITKIELVDGGLVIKSLTANQVKGLSMLHGRPHMGSPEVNDNAVEGRDHFIIDLGGHYNGINYAPDMAQFNNPQIRITWDYSITTTEFGMTGAADNAPAMKFSILAELAKAEAGYQHGYVKSSILKEFTQATSTTNYIEIPDDGQLIGVGVEAGYDALDFTEDVEEIKLDFDNGDWIPFHFKESEIMFQQQVWFNSPFYYSWMADIEDSDELDSHMGYLLDMHFGVAKVSTLATVAGIDPARKGVETLHIYDLATPTVCSEYGGYYMTSIGWAPFHVWYCPSRALVGNKDTIDSSAYGSIELELTSGSSASTSSTPDIIAEYLKI